MTALAGAPWIDARVEGASVCPASAFGGARTLLARVPAAERSVRDGAAVTSGGWQAFEGAVSAILAGAASGPDASERWKFVAALEADPPPVVTCDAGMIARDRLAYTLAMIGYTAADIARILTGEVTRRQLDTDYARRMAGLASLPVTRPLTTAVSGPAAPSPAPIPGGIGLEWPRRARAGDVNGDVLDAYIRHYADTYRVDPRLVTAIIRFESNWDPGSVSPKGAVGLMQLMPATASMLRVNPSDPIDNIRGGIAYLADLLRTYGNVRSALIAYNAGPTHANQVIRGERGLFSETRRYLDSIAMVYPFDNTPDRP